MSRSPAIFLRLALVAMASTLAVGACGGGGGGTSSTVPGGPSLSNSGLPTSAGVQPTSVSATGVPVSSLTCDLVPKAEMQAALDPVLPNEPIMEIKSAGAGGGELKCAINYSPRAQGAMGINVTLGDTYLGAYGHDGSLTAFNEERGKHQSKATPGPVYDEQFFDASGVGEAAYIVDSIYHDSYGGVRSVLYVHRATGPSYLEVFLSRTTNNKSDDPFLGADFRHNVVLAVAKAYIAKLPA